MTARTAPPLPECARCAAPMRRARWAVTGGICSACATPAEAMAAAHRTSRLSAVSLDQAGRRRAETRIQRLLARRARRAAGGA